MKTLVLTIASFVIFTMKTHGQITFDLETDSSIVFFDTLDTNCQWTVGPPMKSIFKSAHSGSNVVVTGLDRHYYTNDTSILYLHHSSPLTYPFPAGIRFYYKMDSDSLKDFGRFEISRDGGRTWINPLLEDTGDKLKWPSGKPILTGKLHQWQLFDLDATDWLYYDVGGPYNPDSVFMRLSFITDTIETFQDGWMIDDIDFVYTLGTIGEPTNSPIKLYPNPCHERINIELNGGTPPILNIALYSISGLLLEKFSYHPGGYIDIHEFPPGIYTLHIRSDGRVMRQRVIKY